MADARHACTIVARNYLAFARVLANSFLEHHPDSRFTVLLLDDDGSIDIEAEPFEVIHGDEIMDVEDFRSMAAIYDVMELATAVKPWLLERLLADGEPVAYIDPDIQLHASIDEAFVRAEKHGIVLTPHVLQPWPQDDHTPTENFVLMSGTFNLGFITVSPAALPFLAWWQQRLRWDCVVDPAKGLFVDQKWIDFAIGIFDHDIIRDPGYNVAYWNIWGREVTRDGDQVLVNGSPLKFFHFSGFDPKVAGRLSKHDGPRPRFVLDDNKVVAELCATYGELLEAAGHTRMRQIPYGVAQLPNGLVLDRRMHRLNRDAVLAYRAGDLDEPPPNPHVDADGFLKWLNAPVTQSGLSRYLHSLLMDRGDVSHAFPETLEDPTRFLNWTRSTGRFEEDVSPLVIPDDDVYSPIGVELTGYLKAEMGVGEAARRMVKAISLAGIPHSTMTYTRTTFRQDHDFEDRSSKHRFPFAIVCVNADQLPTFAADVGPGFFHDRYTIGLWAWEVPDFPSEWMSAFDFVDEVWTISQYTAAALQHIAPVPVVTMANCLEVPAVTPVVSKGEAGIPELFTYLFAFDFLSVFNRKNPLGAVAAFDQAFPEEGEAQLVLKSVNGDKCADDALRLREAIAHRSDIIWIDELLPEQQQRALLAAADCYVSLHRSEGFGFTMAEAMALGKPVVATGYSGNLEFMRMDNSYLVSSRLVEVGEGSKPYPATSEWAEPDIDHAAELLRKVFDDPEHAAEVGERARRHMATYHSIEARGRQITARLTTIAAQREKALPVVPEIVVHGRPSVLERIDHLSVDAAGGRRRSFAAFARRIGQRLLYPMLSDLRGILREMESRVEAASEEARQASAAAHALAERTMKDPNAAGEHGRGS